MKDTRFNIENEVGFPRGKQQSTPKIVFYSVKVSFSIEKKLEIPFLQCKRWFSKKNTRFNIENEVGFPRGRQQSTPYFTVKVSFSIEKIQKTRFSSVKYGFLRKIQYLTSKTRLVFRVEYSSLHRILPCKSQFFYRKKLENPFFQCRWFYKRQFFYRKNLEIPFLQCKRRFSTKNTRFNIENEVGFPCGIQQSTQNIVFYRVKVSFSIEKIQKSGFSSVKYGFLRKIQDLTSKTRLVFLLEYSSLHEKQYFTV